MELITNLLSGGWGWLAGVGLAIVTVVATYFGGKKVGTVQTQAKADVTAANKDADQVKASAEKRVETNKAVNNVHQNVSSLNGDDVDQRLRDRWTKN